MMSPFVAHYTKIFTTGAHVAQGLHITGYLRFRLYRSTNVKKESLEANSFIRLLRKILDV